MKAPDVDYFIKGVVLLAIYIFTARLGLEINAISGFATLIWFPTGISLAALFLLGLRFWPVILIGAFTANYLSGASIPVSIGIGVGNTLEAFLAVFFLKNYFKFRITFDKLKPVAEFILVVTFTTLISASIGALTLFFGEILKLSDFGITWLTWWIGDAVSALVVAPFILIWSRFIGTKFNLSRVLEFSIPFIILILVCFAIFKGTPIGTGNVIKYLLYPPLIWIAIRFSPRVTISTIFILSIFAVAMTVLGLGPFVPAVLPNGLLVLQSFIAITSLTMLLLVASTAENKFYEKRKDEFISVASHELKTPLTSLKLGTELLQRKFARKKDKETFLQLKKLNSQVDRMMSLAVNLLDTKSIHEEKMTLKKENFILSDLAEEIISDISKSTKREIIFIKKDEINVFADKDKIGQVITNFLTNADKYSPKDKKINVSVLKKDKEVIFKVQDFGEGVPADDQKAIFNRYYMVNKDKKTDDLSVGLGLYISKKIILNHKGKIWVESPSKQGSREIKGSSFYFSLPLT